MPTTDTDRLRNIKSFPQLVAYLRDDLDWPIDTDDFDDLTFEYKPEELGIDPKNAAKIEVIKQLRPLVNNQPWGIFWIKFKPKRLPVVALRRILGQLVTKKRASSNKTHQATWNLDDLMLISAIGEDEERQITFAHFAEEPNRNLPTLRILGWDGADTILKLDHLNNELHEYLTWPDLDKESDHEAWRERWSSAFKLKHREVINTSKELSVRLAELARNIRKRCNAALTLETENGPLRSLMASFKQALIHDLNEDDFADMYAQTIAYGLLSARVSRHVPGEDATLMPEDVSDLVLPTNPFLKELMQTFFHVGGRKWSSNKGHLTGIDFDELGINDVVDALKDANMDAVLRDFGDKNPQEDPVIHFYELFLKEYDAKKRMQRGVFYTPKPVVSYIVRSVHELLQTEFGLVDGLADTTTWGEMAARHSPLTPEKARIEDSSSAPSPSGRGQGEGSSSASLPPDLLAFARKLREDQTDAEGLMWSFLRDRRFANFKFRRQHPIQPYILDFYCHEAKLAVELDGGQHNAPNARKQDEKRTHFLNERGIKVLRFWNNEVFNETEAVMSSIWNALRKSGEEKTLTPPSPKGRGSEEFKIPEGVTPDTPFVNILDPATGTATFLVEVIDIIHKTMVTKWEKAGHMELEIPNLWNEYVPKYLLPRLHGYELMMAPYAIAHMKIGLKLFETGYSFGSDERARIYLTNALEPPQDFSDQFEQMAPALAHEAKEVNDVKQYQRFTVVIGNPPYSISSQNSGFWIHHLLQPWKDAVQHEPTVQPLNDDYIKFLCFAQHCLSLACFGILGMITNHTYFRGIVHRGVRQSVLQFFARCVAVDLHGNSLAKEKAPNGQKNENVFDIRQGVGILIAVRSPSSNISFQYADIWGDREEKYTMLRSAAATTSIPETLPPSSPEFRFTREKNRPEYDTAIPVTTFIGSAGSCIDTKRDGVCIAFSKEELRERLRYIASNPTDVIRNQFSLRDSKEWNLATAQSRLHSLDNDRFRRVLFKPFDYRWIYYSKSVVARLSTRVMSQVDPGIGLLCTRQTKDPFAVLITDSLCTHKCMTAFDRTFVIPVGEANHLHDECRSDSQRLALAYAQMYSPQYRKRYENQLATEYPRVFMPVANKLQKHLVDFGNELVALHLLESPLLDTPITTYTGPANPEVEKVSYTPENKTVWLDKAQTRGFVGVPEEVWNFHIGGYQVCHKWLKDRQKKGGKNPRPGRILTADDITHYQKIVVALNETIRLMKEIDEVIEKHGGWPDAFVTERKEP